MPPESAVMDREEQAPNLPAERAQHPIIAAIDQRMPEIAEILPDGMKPERFRKVVVQAMLRNRDLWDCTPISLITAITEAAEVGIEPTGVLGKGWLIPYKGEAKFIPGWRGFVDLLWRADRILLSVDLVRIGDEFSYRRGTDKYLHHVPDLSDPEREASDDNVTFAYVMAQFPDGREDFEVMSRVALDRIKDAALAKAKDKSKAIWTLHPGEMMKKTPIRRMAKRLPLSPAVQAMLARDEEIDFDTPVERVPDPKRDGLRDRIAQRTAALRGESTGESEGSEPLAGTRAESERARHAAGAEPGESVSPPPAAPRRGDPWMARLHAVGNERGYDHDALHDWATRLYGIASLTDLNPKQRGEFMHRVEVLPLIGESCAHPAEQHVVTDTALTCGACGEVIADRTQPGRAARAHAEGSPAPASTSAPADEDAPASEGGGVRSGALPSDSDAASESSPSGSATSPAQAASPPGSPESVVAPATFTDPASLETYGAAVLGFEEPVPLKDWAPAEWDQVWSALGLADPGAYEAWYTALERPLRAALMTAHQSPAARRKAAKEAATAKPDAETLRMGLDA